MVGGLVDTEDGGNKLKSVYLLTSSMCHASYTQANDAVVRSCWNLEDDSSLKIEV